MYYIPGKDMHLSCRHQLLPTHLLGSSSEWSQIYPVSPRRDPSAPPPSRDASDSEALCKEAPLRLGDWVNSLQILGACVDSSSVGEEKSCNDI